MRVKEYEIEVTGLEVYLVCCDHGHHAGFFRHFLHAMNALGLAL